MTKTKLTMKYAEKNLCDVDNGGLYCMMVAESGRYRHVKIGETLRPVLNRCYEVRHATQRDFRIMGSYELDNRGNTMLAEAIARQVFIRHGAKLYNNKKDYFVIEETYDGINAIFVEITEMLTQCGLML